MTWTYKEDIGILSNDVKIKVTETIYGFDFDGTLVNTKSNRKFSKDKNDVKLWNDCIVNRLQKLHTKGITIVIFTNQLGLLKNTGLSMDEWKEKIDWFLGLFDFPIKVYASCLDNGFRKPSKLMWNYFVKHECDGKVNKKNCLYIGDAAGRTGAEGGSSDFSASDRKFAMNIGIKFLTPEEFFLNGESKEYNLIGFNPQTYKPPSQNICIKPKKSQELIVLVASPATGKSTFTKKYFPNYVRINQDTLKTKVKCIKETEINLALGKSVVIDNTNGDPSTRAEYIKIAIKHNVPTRCFYLESSAELNAHLNNIRHIMNNQKKIPPIAFNVYYKKFVYPTEDEGFTEVIKVPFIPYFENKVQKMLYKQIY